MWRLAARLSPSAALPAQEGAHEETRLLGSIGMVRADRTGAPRPTSLPHTIGARCVFQMAGASRDIVGARREGAHGASLQAPATRARLAWARNDRRFGCGQRFAEPQRAAIGVPKAVIRMN